MSMKLSVADGHLCNMGRMIEEMESKLRNSLDQVLLDYRIHISIDELGWVGDQIVFLEVIKFSN